MNSRLTLKFLRCRTNSCSQKMRAVALLDLTKPLLYQPSTRSHDDRIYSMAGIEFCIALNIALAMSGCKAIVQSCNSDENTKKWKEDN